MALYQYPIDEQTALFLGEAVVMTARIEAGWAHCALGRAGRPPDQPGYDTDHAAPGASAPEYHRRWRLPRRGHRTRIRRQYLHPDRGIASGWGRAGQAILVRSSGLQAPDVGSVVHLTAVGTAHVLKNPRPSVPAKFRGLPSCCAHRAVEKR
jgi:iron(III) transport system ATP-binding protein